jgi:hypothetical protein
MYPYDSISVINVNMNCTGSITHWSTQGTDSIRVIGTRVLADGRLRFVGPRSRRPDLAGEEANLTDCPALGKGVLKK